MITAVKRGKWQDTIITLIANLSASIPGFVLAVGLMYLLSVKYKLLPTSGFTFPWVDFGKHFQQIIMPMFCLSLGGVAGVCRQTRSSMLEAIRQDYVRTARSKGLEENTIISKHVLKNGLIPIVTLIGGRLAMMIGGSVFIENVFSIPGMGSLMVNSVNNFDIPVIQACVLLTAVIISLATGRKRPNPCWPKSSRCCAPCIWPMWSCGENLSVCKGTMAGWGRATPACLTDCRRSS